MSGEEGGGWELHMEVEKQLLGKHLFAGPCRDAETTRPKRQDADLQALRSLPHHTQSIVFVDVSADSSIPRTDPFSEFFHAVRGKARRKASFLFLKNNQPKLILIPKRHILGWPILFPTEVFPRAPSKT